MGLYSYSGGYSGYNKNNKEREALDYYATPTEEVYNILDKIELNLLSSNIENMTILEPCAGAGHMLQGINQYCIEHNINANIIATDIKDRNNIQSIPILTGEQYDFLSEQYPYDKNIDWIIMNPPYATIEPFTIKALSVAQQGVLLLGRLQFLEGEKRFNTIFKNFPPNEVYIYVDRIACYRNGDFSEKPASAQAYAWFLWHPNLNENIFHKETKIYWIRRTDKKDK